MPENKVICKSMHVVSSTQPLYAIMLYQASFPYTNNNLFSLRFTISGATNYRDPQPSGQKQGNMTILLVEVNQK